MRFMVLVKANKETEAGVLPTTEEFAKMGEFNEQMVKAGVMLAADGLQPSSKGSRIKFNAGRPSVTDGPFAETKELVCGFWIIQVKSKEEAIQWISRAPFSDQEVEIRQVFELEDFGENLTPELRSKEEFLGAQLK